MPVNHQLLLLLFLLTSKTGFSAEIPVSVLTGTSVQLHIQTQQLPEFDDLYWTKDKSENLVKYTSESKKVKLYEDRVDFNNKTFSLTLKNIQKKNSGLYTARASGKSENNIATYKVSVIDAVEAPVLTVNSDWSSSDSCTVNFTCRAHELMINSSYQNNTCSPQEVTSLENYTLILDCIEEFIICNHSNPVSWKQDTINIIQLCDDNKNKNPERIQRDSSVLWIVVGLVAFSMCSICALIVLHRKCKKGAEEVVLHSSTLYAQVEEMQRLNSDCHTYDTPDQAQAQTSQESGDKRPNTTYCTVGQFQKPTPSAEKDCTIYAAVCKPPNKKPPAISASDT